MRLLLVFLLLPLLMSASDNQTHDTEKNPSSELLIELAEQGQDAEAQYSHGLMYFKGKDVSQDYGKAREMYGKAVQIGGSQSEQLLHLIQDRETGAQQSEIDLKVKQPFQESENFQQPGILHEPEWLLSKNKDYYAIQVIAVNNSWQIKRFADQHVHQAD